MGLKEGVATLREQVDQQLEFIEWLKSNELYNPNESGVTMQKMYAVWEGIRDDNNKLIRKWKAKSDSYKHFRHLLNMGHPDQIYTQCVNELKELLK
jgi:hypothetical protein